MTSEMISAFVGLLLTLLAKVTTNAEVQTIISAITAYLPIIIKAAEP